MAARTPARRGVTLAAIGAIALAITAVLSPTAATAAFPGSNGRIAYAGPSAADAHIFTILPDGSGLQQLTDDPPARDTEPSWSADGGRLVFTRQPEGFYDDRQVFTINADGGDPTPIVHAGPIAPDDVSPSFSPSGRRIVYTAGDAIRTIRTDGTKRRRLVTGATGQLEERLAEPTYSPTGRRIAFAGRPDGRRKDGIWSMRRNGSRLRRLTDPPTGGGGKRPVVWDGAPDYSPDGRHIAFHRLSWIGVGERGVPARSRGIRVMRADGSRERRIPGTDGAMDPAYAPAGDRIAVSITLRGSPLCSDLYTISPAGSDSQRVTHDCDPNVFVEASPSSPSWQPLPDGP